MPESFIGTGSPGESVLHALQFATYTSRIVFGTAWGGLLSIAGWHVLSLPARSADDLLLQLTLGVTALAAGNFIFMAIVADRVFHTPRRSPIDMLEFGAAGLMVVSALAAAVLLLRSGGS